MPNVFTDKLGPLPVWGWMGIATGAAILWHMHQSTSGTSASSAAQQVASQVPQFVNQTYVTTPPSVNNVTVNGTEEPVTSKTPKPPPGKKSTPPPKKGGGGQKMITVTVGNWNPTNAPWNSTLWGIAEHYNVKGGYQTLAKINGIKDPNLIYPGQHIQVPVS